MKILMETCSKKKYKWVIRWPQVIIIFLLHVGAIYGLYLYRTQASIAATIFGKMIALISNLGITAGAHRLWCHRTYKASKALEIFLMTIVSLTYQNSVYTWTRDHRMHHKYSETDADPHNAKRGFFYSHMGWLMIKKHPEVKAKGQTLDLSDLEANPIVMFQHKYYHWIVFVVALVFPASFSYFVIGETLGTSIFSVCLYRYVISVHMTWCINSLAHLYGFRPYDKTIGPVEQPILKVLVLGEGFHNYHHTFPWDYKAAEFGGTDIRNPTTIFIDTCAYFGLASDLKAAKQSLVHKMAATKGDGTHEKTTLFDTPSFKRLKMNLQSFLAFALFVTIM